MKRTLLWPILLASSTLLIASCGPERGGVSSPSIEDSSDTISSEKELTPDDYLNDYRMAMKYGAIQQDFSVDIEGGPLQIGVEMLEEKKLLPDTWNDFTLNGESFAFSSKVNGFGRGKEKMVASMHVPESHFKVSGKKIPSFIEDKTNFTAQMDAYLEKGVIYADLSKQSLLNYVMQIMLRNMTGDKTWELVDQGNYTFTSDEWETFQGLCLYVSNTDPVDRFFAVAHEKAPSSMSFREAGDLLEMTARLDNEADLEAVMISGADMFYEEVAPMLSSMSMPGSASLPSLPEKADVIAKIRKALEAIEFTSFLRTVRYEAERGVLEESYALNIASFDHDLLYDLLYGKDGLMPEDPKKEETFILPAGELHLSFDLTRAYGSRQVVADKLSEEEKAAFTTPLTFPTWNKENPLA